MPRSKPKAETFVDTFFIIIAVICGIVGIIGSVVPGLPGPPISWLGLMLMYFFGGTNRVGDSMSIKFLLLWLGITVVVSILDYIVPARFTRLTGGSKYAGRGAIIGLLVGLFFSGVGILVGILAGAFIAEMVFAGKEVWPSAKAAFGAFLGFIAGTGLKLITTGFMMYYIIVYI